MGFYGNITNSAKTQMTFDKTYSSRTEMDLKCSTDGVFVGRYVLVEYDKNYSIGSFIDVAKVKNRLVVPHLSSSNQETYEKMWIKEGDRIGSRFITKGTLLRVPGKKSEHDTYIYNWDDPEDETDHFYIYKGDVEASSEIALDPNGTFIVGKPTEVTLPNWAAQLEEIQPESTDPASNYVVNYNLDISKYGKGRGYDSTVWQKVYDDNKQKYVMIAELNSVVPIIGISADAPTMTPMPPHFDLSSTDVYYLLHWQPQWGMRIKGSEANSEHTSDKTEYPSDEKVNWIKTKYNSTTGIITNTKSEVDGAIYYNKAGFNPEYITYSADEDYPGWNEDSDNEQLINKVTDKISILPTGISGNLYDHHTGDSDKVAEDIQEISIMLPSIGDTIAKVWDTVYGDREINQGDKRNTSINWKNAKSIENTEGLRLVEKIDSNRFGYQKAKVNTLAGAVNSVHDLLGMIITDDYDSTTPSTLNENYIYYDKQKGTYSYKYLSYDYTPIDNLQDIKYNRVGELTKWNGQSFYIDSTNPEKPDYVKDINNYHEGMKYILNVTKGPTVDITKTFNPKDYYIKEIIKNEYLNASYITYTGAKGDFDVNEKENYFSIVDGSINIENYLPVELTKEEYENKDYQYYVKTGEKSFDLAVEEYNESTQYYEKPEIYYPGKYYYAVYNKATYIDNVGINHTDGYLPEKVYEANVNAGAKYFVLSGSGTDENGRYDLAEEAPREWVEDRVYYTRTLVKSNFATSGTRPCYKVKTINNGNEPSGEVHYIQVYSYVPITLDEESYRPNAYYIYKSVSEGYVLDVDAFNEGTQYYEQKITLQQYIDSNAVDLESAVKVKKFINLGDKQYFYFKNNVYTQLTNATYTVTDKVDNIILYTFEVAGMGNTYESNRYYYEILNDDNYNGSLILDTRLKLTDKTVYYDYVTPGESDNTKYYIPNKYWYELNGEYILDTSLDPTPGRIYYTRNAIYVYNDNNHIYDIGSEWNTNVEIPEGVTLATRSEKWELKELPGFAKDINSLHGMLLRLNKILLENDKYTRDTRSVQGSINKINDIIHKINELNPTNILIVDEYGRIHGSPQTTDKWIEITVNDDKTNPNIHIEHQFTKKNDTTSNSNVNDNGDTINLYTPIVDEKGHVVGKNIETVTLPYGFKTIKITNDNSENNPSNSINSSGQIADNTQDILTLSSSNKWIVLDNNTEDTIKIGHSISDLANGEHKLNAQTPLFGSTFNIQTFTTDKGGHLIGKGTETVTIPKGSLTDANSNGADLITQLQFNPSTGALSTTRTNVGSLLITGYVIGEDNKITNSDTINSALGKLQGQINALDYSDSNSNNTQIITKITQTDGKINITRSNAGTLLLTGYVDGSNSKISANDSIISAFGKLQSQINSLDYNDVENNTQIINKITQNDGKISVTRSNAGTLLLTGYILGADSNAIAETDTINSAFSKLQLNVNNIKNLVGNTKIETQINNAVNSLKESQIPNISSSKITDIANYLKISDLESQEIITSILSRLEALESK